MHPRIFIRGSVRRSVGRLVGWSVRLAFFRSQKSANLFFLQRRRYSMKISDNPNNGLRANSTVKCNENEITMRE